MNHSQFFRTKQKTRTLVDVLQTYTNIKYSINPIDRLVVSGDVSTNPFYHAHWRLNPISQIVVWPNNSIDLAQFIKFCNEKHINYVIRGGATSYFGECLPKNNEAVIDLKMWHSIEFHSDTNTVSVFGAVTFSELRDFLEHKNISLKIFPTSEKSASIGGWFSMGGVSGVGTIKYGTILNYVLEIMIVTPEGDCISISDRSSIGEYFGSQGSKGIIYGIKIDLNQFMSDTKLLPYYVTFSDVSKLDDFLDEIQNIKELYHCRVSNYNSSNIGQKVNGHNDIHDFGVLLIFEINSAREKVTFSSVTFNKLIDKYSGRIEKKEISMYEWLHNSDFEIIPKKYGSVLLIQQYLLTKTNFQDVYKNYIYLAQKYNYPILFLLNLTADGKMRFVIFIPSTHKTWDYFLGAKAMIHRLSRYILSKNDKMYSYGLLNNIYNHNGHLDGLKTRSNIFLNPIKTKTNFSDKRYKTNSLFNIRIRMLFAFNALYRTSRSRNYNNNHNTEENSSKNYLEKNPFFQCSNCGYCRTGCPAFEFHRNESYSPSGIFRIIRTSMENQLEITRDFLPFLFHCTNCAYCNEMCPLNLPIYDMIEKTRAMILNNDLSRLNK